MKGHHRIAAPFMLACQRVRVNRLFRLGDGDIPRPDLFRWSGDLPLQPGGPPVEAPIMASPP